MHQRVLIFVILLISGFFFIDTRGSRGGGRGGGSFRSGGSRITGSRSSGSRGSSGTRSGGSVVRLGTSSRYSSWTRYHGFKPGFSYRYSTYNDRRYGIANGLVIMSFHQRTRFVVHDEMSYDNVEFCYNEQPLYGRNITVTPWFMCPWDDPRERYCCGEDIEQRCCKYFDRPGHLAALICGIVITLVFIVGISYCCCCKKQHSKGSLSSKFNGDKFENEVQYPLYPVAPVQTIEVCNTYPVTSVTDNICPPYPVSNDISPPYPIPSEPNSEYPPYPSMNPSAPMPQPTFQQWGPSGYDDTGPRYPLIPSEVPPPSYKDVVKQ